MIKPDVIVTWPKNVDFPLWREYVHLNRDKFNNIIVVFMEPNVMPDYSSFIKEAMFPDFVQFVDSRPLLPNEDWRNVAVNQGLFHSLHSEWLFFTEQDFFPKAGFWEEVEQLASRGHNVIYVNDNGRMHPCCIFIKRTILNQTSKYFSARPDEGYDHFGKLQMDLLEMAKDPFNESNPWPLNPETYYHYNGLSQNFRLMTSGQEPNYHKEEFNQYLYKCLDVSVPLDPRFVNIVKGYLEFERL